jgi:AmmeMemoRadiSam system protein A
MTSAPAFSPLTVGEQRELLRLARAAIGSALGLTAQPLLALETPSLCATGSAFVSLLVAEQLRGCVGSPFPRDPLHATVVAMARAAAFNDPRFLPVTPEEWTRLMIEISRLGPLTPAAPESIVPGRHGLYVVQGPARGLLLPQVALRHDWDRERFLAETCRKAGLEPDAWRQPGTDLLTFEAEVFGEVGAT